MCAIRFFDVNAHWKRVLQTYFNKLQFKTNSTYTSICEFWFKILRSQLL